MECGSHAAAFDAEAMLRQLVGRGVSPSAVPLSERTPMAKPDNQLW